MTFAPNIKCTQCGGRGSFYNPSTHDGSPCGACQGKGFMPPLPPEEAQKIVDSIKDLPIITKLRTESHAALDKGDFELAQLLSKAATALEKKK